jgi:CheY-like chemotaxis protein/HPt (histidine-containing phosphotransfer) domain-containing protein
MDYETQSRVFEAFTQADTSTTREYGGTGLGLAISKQYVEMMGGTISVRSEQGEGTSITINLPLKNPKIDYAARDAYKGFSAHLFCERAETYEMIASHLELCGIHCQPGTNEEDTLDRLGPKDLVVVDYDYFSHNPGKRDYFDKIKRSHVIVVTPLTMEAHFPELDRWESLTRPITSKSVYQSLKTLQKSIYASPRTTVKDEASGASERHRILVAEDVETNQRIAREMLQILDCDVEIANNGQEAVEKYTAGDFELIFMDCQMPVMDGFEATIDIRDLENSLMRDRTPIVALTAGIGREDRDRCTKVGMDGYLTKPFSIRELETTIRRFVQNDTESARKETNGQRLLPQSLTPPSVDTEEVFNMKAINNIREIESQTGKILLPSILEGFKDQMTAKLIEIEKHADQGDSQNFYKAAHAIKSMSANIGAEKIRILAATLEQAGRGENIEDVSEELSQLHKAYSFFVRAFERKFIS